MRILWDRARVSQLKTRMAASQKMLARQVKGLGRTPRTGRLVRPREAPEVRLRIRQSVHPKMTPVSRQMARPREALESRQRRPQLDLPATAQATRRKFRQGMEVQVDRQGARTTRFRID